METLVGFAGTGAGFFIVFAMYLGGAGVVLKVVDRLLPCHRRE